MEVGADSRYTSSPHCRRSTHTHALSARVRTPVSLEHDAECGTQDVHHSHAQRGDAYGRAASRLDDTPDPPYLTSPECSANNELPKSAQYDIAAGEFEESLPQCAESPTIEDATETIAAEFMEESRSVSPSPSVSPSRAAALPWWKQRTPSKPKREFREKHFRGWRPNLTTSTQPRSWADPRLDGPLVSERRPGRGFQVRTPTLPRCDTRNGNSRYSPSQGPARPASVCADRPDSVCPPSSSSSAAQPGLPQTAAPASRPATPSSAAASDVAEAAPNQSRHRQTTVLDDLHLQQEKRHRAKKDFNYHVEREPMLGTLVKKMFDALVIWNKKHKIHSSVTWKEVFRKVDLDQSGRISFGELAAVICHHLQTGISRYELCMIWRLLDGDSSGQVTMQEFALLVYRIEIATWPSLAPEQLARCVRRLNDAAHYWHRSGGNWFKIFTEIDADDSGYISFDELLQCVRGPFPGLRQSERDISDADVQGLWKALDPDYDIEIPVSKFMTFMRHHGAALSMHKLTRYSQAKRSIFQGSASTKSSRASQAHDKSKLREIAGILENAMKASWSMRGVHANTTSSLHGTSLGNWSRFFAELNIGRARRLKYDDFRAAIVDNFGKLSVTDEELHTLWVYLSKQSSREVTAKDLVQSIYQLELEDWPDLDGEGFRRIVDEMNVCAQRRHFPSSGTNWSKLYSLADPGGAGHISYMHMKQLIRDGHGLGITKDSVSDGDVRAIWKAMDRHASGHVSAAEFMAFMRKHGTPNKSSLGSQKAEADASEQLRDAIRADVLAAPELSDAELLSVARRLTVAVQSWLAGRTFCMAVGPRSRGLWAQFIGFICKDNSGRITFTEFGDAVSDVLALGSDISGDELKALWRYIDENRRLSKFCLTSNDLLNITAVELDSAIYKLQVSQWPRLDDATLARIVGVLNNAADHWHRCSGNWFKVFATCDEDGSGNIEFGEFVEMIRKNYPGLSVTPREISLVELQGLWRALDENCCGMVVVRDFMVLMRKYGEEMSMHKLTQYSMKRRSQALDSVSGASRADSPITPARSQEELRATKDLLERALAAYWTRRGVSLTSSVGWERFFDEADANGNKRLTLPEVKEIIQKRLKRPTEWKSLRHRSCLSSKPMLDDSMLAPCMSRWPKVGDQVKHLGGFQRTLQDIDGNQDAWRLEPGEVAIVADVNEEGDFRLYNSKGVETWHYIFRNEYGYVDQSIVEGVSIDDLRALWANVDTDGSGEITVADWKLALYRIELHFWPEDNAAMIADVIEKMNAAAEKWHHAGGNWYKIFTKLDPDHSGSMEFEEMRAMLRRPLPCLAIPQKTISDASLKRFWKAMDTDLSGNVTVQEFMVFMRRRAKAEVQKVSMCIEGSSRRTSAAYNQQMTMPDSLTEDQKVLIWQRLGRQSYETIAAAYARWQKPFSGLVGELDWLRITREILGISEEQLHDEAVHLAWCVADPDGLGELHLNVLFEMQDKLRPNATTSGRHSQSI